MMNTQAAIIELQGPALWPWACTCPGCPTGGLIGQGLTSTVTAAFSNENHDSGNPSTVTPASCARVKFCRRFAFAVSAAN